MWVSGMMRLPALAPARQHPRRFPWIKRLLAADRSVAVNAIASTGQAARIGRRFGNVANTTSLDCHRAYSCDGLGWPGTTVYGITACPTNERMICQAAVWPNPGCRLIGRERGKLTCLHHPWLALRIALRQQALCRIGLHPRVAYRAFSPWLAARRRARHKPCVDARSRTISAKQAV